MKRIGMGLIILMALPAFADIRTDMLTDRIDRLDREMTLLQKRVYQATPQTGQPSVPVVDGGNLEDMYAHLDAQEQSLQELTRKVEEIGFAQAQLKERMEVLKADIDVRFAELEKTARSVTTQSTDKKPIPAKKPKMEKSDVKGDKVAYEAAYELLRKNKYDEAERAFRLFMSEYPKSSLVGNANYWLGETYYVRGQYETAAGIFADGFTKYQSNSKAPDNLLKLGLTMKTLGKKEEACTAWMSLAEMFPLATDVIQKRAIVEAEKLGCPKN